MRSLPPLADVVTLKCSRRSSTMDGASPKAGRILGKLGETTLCGKAFAKLFAVERRTH